MIEDRFVDLISEVASAKPAQVKVAIELFDKGATIPFVARYRKDATGNLDEVALETIENLNTQYIAFTNRRDAILENVEKQGKLTPELKAQIQGCSDAVILEDLYLPFKKARKTKATIAREQGLEPLSEFVWAQVPGEQSIEALAATYVSEEKGVSDPDAALLGARNILAERIAQDADLRQHAREVFHAEGVLTTAATKNTEEQKTKFEAYYDFKEPIKSMPSHRLLAVLRGVRKGFLRMDLAVDDDAFRAEMTGRYCKETGGDLAAQMVLAIEDSYKRLIQPTIENEVIQAARKVADDAATQVFRENAENLLLASPAGHKPVLGVDPGLRTGSKLAVIDQQGTFQESATIYTTEPKKDEAAAAATLMDLINRHQVELVAIGNGTGSREINQFIRNVLKENDKPNITTVFVNEAGASIYSASEVARNEFPELDLTIRGAISIARRLQDPLAELVKLEPRHVGVGQYQHDVNQKQLREGLSKTIESCVNRVGVDLNTASVELLRYVSGIQQNTAQNIVKFRMENGPFQQRTQLTEVSGVGEKTFEQCAGFLRVQNGIEPLDQTAIHPEAYGIVSSMAGGLAVESKDLIRNQELVDKLKLEEFANEKVGTLALSDIKLELLRPGRDPRQEFKAPQFLDGIDDVKDLEIDMVTEGVVTNVTDFGAFVDIGVHQDGLVHLSELANRFIKDPHDVVKVGEIVRVKVIKIDAELRRVSLSRKALQSPPKPREKSAEEKGAKTADKGGDRRAPSGQKPESRRRARPVRNENTKGQAKKGGRSKGGNPGGNRKPAAPKDNMNTLLADQLAALKDKFNNN